MADPLVHFYPRLKVVLLHLYINTRWSNRQKSLGCHTLIKSPRVTVSAATVLPTLFNFLGKPLKLISSNHTRLTYGCGKIFWHPFRWPWVKVTKLPKRNVIYLVRTVKWEPLIQSYMPQKCIYSLIMNEILHCNGTIFPSNWNCGGKIFSETVLFVTPKEPTIVLLETDGDGW